MLPLQELEEADLMEVSGGPLPAAAVYVAYFFGGFSAGRAAMELATEVYDMIKS